jgi:16S rRNA (cytosine967-C5)-methyltransferase
MKASSLVGHALELLETVDRSQQPPDRIASQFFKDRRYLGSHDRRFLSEALFAFIRRRRYLEALLEQFIGDHPGSEDLNRPRLRYTPLMEIYRCVDPTLSNLNEIQHALELQWRIQFPSTPLDSFRQWTVAHRSLDFLGGESSAVQLGVQHSFQDWMVEEWLEAFGPETKELLRAMNEPAPITLRINSHKATREHCRSRLAEEGIETVPTRFSPVGLTASKRFTIGASQTFRDGWYEVQDEGSQLISLLVEPKPDTTIVDACAGAGGKTLHLADMMDDRGELVAIDVDRQRLQELEHRSFRAGLHCVRIHQREALQAETLQRAADLVLVDAPCSGTGTIRRNPSLKWSVNESLVEHYAVRQSELLEFNAAFVKPGGKLAYSTCSLLRDENERVVENFLGAQPSFRILPLGEQAASLGLQIVMPFVKLMPHRHGTDGFFLALLQRIG